ncbi:MAG: N-acetylmuramoyl-L-alanine amidase [bacterium]
MLRLVVALCCLVGTTSFYSLPGHTFAPPVNAAPKAHAVLDVIVLDAGHGGKDPGAIGVNGVMEKSAALAIVLKLGKLIEEEMPGVKVVYTRNSDKFIELYRRGEIANAKKGKLFVCVHCNSTPKKPTTAGGMETYILRPGKTDAAIKVAARENAVIKYEKNKKRYEGLSDIDFILTSMSRSQDVKYSEKLAGMVQAELQKTVGLKNHGVSQAGFFVLVGASMPSVYVETAYISNPKEEKILGSNAGQMKYARGILDAIKKYKTIYEGS